MDELGIERESDNEEEIEFLKFFLKVLEDFIVLSYMKGHGYDYKINGSYPYWEKERQRSLFLKSLQGKKRLKKDK